jgi:hypothetical protein
VGRLLDEAFADAAPAGMRLQAEPEVVDAVRRGGASARSGFKLVLTG